MARDFRLPQILLPNFLKWIAADVLIESAIFVDVWRYDTNRW